MPPESVHFQFCRDVLSWCIRLAMYYMAHVTPSHHIQLCITKSWISTRDGIRQGRITYLCLSLDDRVCRMTGICLLLEKTIFCFINGPTSNISKQTSYLATFFILDFQEHVFTKVPKTHTFAGARKANVQGLSKDMFVEVQNSKMS